MCTTRRRFQRSIPTIVDDDLFAGRSSWLIHKFILTRMNTKTALVVLITANVGLAGLIAGWAIGKPARDGVPPAPVFPIHAESLLVLGEPTPVTPQGRGRPRTEASSPKSQATGVAVRAPRSRSATDPGILERAAQMELGSSSSIGRPAETAKVPARVNLDETVRDPATSPLGSDDMQGLTTTNPAPDRSVSVFSAARSTPVEARAVPQPSLLQAVDDATAAALTPRQAQEIAKLQQDFSDAVGGPGQNANDPNYLARWLLAQRLSEQQAEIVLGSVFMDRYRAILSAETAGR